MEDDMHRRIVGVAGALVSGVALVAMSACGSSSTAGGASSFEAQIQGTWLESTCDAGIGDFSKHTVAVSGLNVTFTNQHYTDGTCTVKANVVDGPFTGSIVVGSAVTASLGGTAVTAYPEDWHDPSGSTYYGLMYVDTSATPNRLYFGDASGANDASTAAKRPTTLDVLSAHVKQ
jgi:hypothetical protein